MSKPDALTAVTSRAATDREFRHRLLTNSAAAVEEVTGSKMPSDVKLQFIERNAGYDATIVLPDFIAAEDALSADELEAVAGGAVGDLDPSLMWCDKVCISTIVSL